MKPTSVDLSACRAKIERAYEHRDSLQAIIPRPLYDKPDLVQLSAKLDPQTGQHVFRVAAIDDEWRLRVGVFLGDIVHNLRSALDHLFWALSCRYLGIAKTERMYKSVQFPIEDGSQGLANKRKHFGGIPSVQWAVIDGAQPYDRADPAHLALRALRELSNRDKHRALNPLLMRSVFIEFDTRVLATDATTDFDFPDSTERALGDQHLEVGTQVVRVGLPEEVDSQVEEAGHITPGVQLPEWDVKIVFGVNVMIDTVRRIVDDIAVLI